MKAFVFKTEREKQRDEAIPLKNIKVSLGDLEKLLMECDSKRGYEDSVYRFYHQSYKVYDLQAMTVRIADALQGLASHLPLNDWFRQIVQEGTGKQFALEHNDQWLIHTRPIVEAFFHARYMLEMICKYGRILKEPVLCLPSGWAAVLYLYNLR